MRINIFAQTYVLHHADSCTADEFVRVVDREQQHILEVLVVQLFEQCQTSEASHHVWRSFVSLLQQVRDTCILVAIQAVQSKVLYVSIWRVHQFQHLSFIVRSNHQCVGIYFIDRLETESRVANDVRFKDVSQLSPLADANTHTQQAQQFVGHLVLKYVYRVCECCYTLAFSHDETACNEVLFAEVAIVASIEDNHAAIWLDFSYFRKDNTCAQVTQRVFFDNFRVVPASNPCRIQTILVLHSFHHSLEVFRTLFVATCLISPIVLHFVHVVTPSLCFRRTRKVHTVRHTMFVEDRQVQIFTLQHVDNVILWIFAEVVTDEACTAFTIEYLRHLFADSESFRSPCYHGVRVGAIASV